MGLPRYLLKLSHILHNEMIMRAVAMTNLSETLAHVGLGHNHHRFESPIQTVITIEAINKGEMVAANQQSIHCRVKSYPLGAAVIAPLKQRGETI
jgi:two-component system, LytTR family, sensor histidine kinase LytS